MIKYATGKIPCAIDGSFVSEACERRRVMINRTPDGSTILVRSHHKASIEPRSRQVGHQAEIAEVPEVRRYALSF
jgi:hypothetical protein